MGYFTRKARENQIIFFVFFQIAKLVMIVIEHKNIPTMMSGMKELKIEERKATIKINKFPAISLIEQAHAACMFGSDL